MALNDYLSEEREDNEKRYNEALGDILGRLQAAQKELKELRSEREVYMLGLKVRPCVRGGACVFAIGACWLPALGQHKRTNQIAVPPPPPPHLSQNRT